jgi:hypothetical protein
VFGCLFSEGHGASGQFFHQDGLIQPGLERRAPRRARAVGAGQW